MVSVSVSISMSTVRWFKVCYRWNRWEVRLAPRLLLTENIGALLVAPWWVNMITSMTTVSVVKMLVRVV